MSPLPRIARLAIAAFVADERYVAPLLGPSRPVFVSLHDGGGALRGCVGHLAATRADLGAEVAHTAVLAATNDPRFPPVSRRELADLVIEVSVLGPPEPATETSLDPRRYGIVVRSGGRRGVLLPDLEGVDTVEAQVRIACRKAGILAGEPVTIERFAVEKFR